MVNALGIDISSYQGSTWGSFAKNKAFALAKCTEGTGYTSPDFAWDWAEIRKLGLVRGAYHFGRPATDAAAQAAYFLATVRSHGLLPGDLLALDLEVSDGLPPAAVAAWAQRFLAAVRRAVGNAVLVYTFPNFAQTGHCAGLGVWPLWIADPNHPAGHPTVPAPWKSWAFHQYSTRPLDEDCFNGDVAALKAFASPPKPVEDTMPSGTLTAPVGKRESISWPTGSVKSVTFASDWQGIQPAAPEIDLRIVHTGGPYEIGLHAVNGVWVFTLGNPVNAAGMSVTRKDTGPATVGWSTA